MTDRSRAAGGEAACKGGRVVLRSGSGSPSLWRLAVLAGFAVACGKVQRDTAGTDRPASDSPAPSGASAGAGHNAPEPTESPRDAGTLRDAGPAGDAGTLSGGSPGGDGSPVGGAGGAAGGGDAAGGVGDESAMAGAGGVADEPVSITEPASSISVLSGNGRYLVFKSWASLVPGLDTSTSGVQVFRRDLQSGSIELVSRDQAGAPAVGQFGGDSLGVSFDGRYVVFPSSRMSADGGGSNQQIDVYLRDIALGTTELVSLGVDGSKGDGYSFQPTLSNDGRFLAFISRVTPGSSMNHVFVRDMMLGSTIAVDLPWAGGEANNSADSAYISGNGRYVAFSSRATNLLAEPTGAAEEVFVSDLSTGTIVTASLGPGGCGEMGDCESPSISADGHYVAFYALVDGPRFFRRDLQTGEVLPASVSYDGSPVSERCFGGPPVMSADGRYFAFSSCANNLVPNDTNQPNVLVRDFATRSTVSVSVMLGGRGADGSAFWPSISADGALVSFTAGNTFLDSDVFVRSRPAP